MRFQLPLKADARYSPPASQVQRPQKAAPLSAGLNALRMRTAAPPLPARPPRGWRSRDRDADRTTWRGIGGGRATPLCPQRPAESAGGGQGLGPGCRMFESAVLGPAVVWGIAWEGRRVGRRFCCPPIALRAVAAPSPVTGRCGPRSLPLLRGGRGHRELRWQPARVRPAAASSSRFVSILVPLLGGR